MQTHPGCRVIAKGRGRTPLLPGRDDGGSAALWMVTNCPGLAKSLCIKGVCFREKSNIVKSAVGNAARQRRQK